MTDLTPDNYIKLQSTKLNKIEANINFSLAEYIVDFQDSHTDFISKNFACIYNDTLKNSCYNHFFQNRVELRFGMILSFK